MQAKRIYIIAGEASGDMHAANMMKAFLKQAPETEFRYYGGERMEAVGGTLVQHYKDLSFMGFWEVLMHAKTVLTHLKNCKEDVEQFKADALILIDFPSFNLRVAKHAKSLGIPVYYYISPQIWAWKKKRVFDIKKIVNHTNVILPFEEEFYQKYGVDVSYVGHPLLDAIRTEDRVLKGRVKSTAKKQIALLPGSRKMEIDNILPDLALLSRKYPEYDFVCTAMSHHPIELYQSHIGDAPVKIVVDDTYGVLRSSWAAIVASGTATLETALFNVPQVVGYRVSPISAAIARILVKVEYVSLVNLILDRWLVQELIQEKFTQENLESALNDLISGEGRTKMLNGYQELHEILGSGGASEKVAKSILGQLN